MLRWVLLGVSLELLIAVQAVLAPHLAVAGVDPDLPLVAALVIALQAGPSRGALAGVFVGLSLDLLQGSRLGLFALAAGLAGWVCGEAAVRVDTGRGLVRWFLATAAAALYQGVVALFWVLGRYAMRSQGVLHHVLVAALYDGVLVALASWPWAARARRSALRRGLGLGGALRP
jgi:rod shape-determining protein MreD